MIEAGYVVLFILFAIWLIICLGVMGVPFWAGVVVVLVIGWLAQRS